MIQNQALNSNGQNPGTGFFRKPGVHLLAGLFFFVFTFFFAFQSSPALGARKNSGPRTVVLDFKDVDLPVFIRFVSDVT